MDKISWKVERREFANLVEHEKNPRTMTEAEHDHIKNSLDRFGLIEKPVVNLDDNIIIGGHQRIRILQEQGETGCDCWIPDRQLNSREVEELNIRLNANQAHFDTEALANNYDLPDLNEWGLPEFILGLGESEEDRIKKAIMKITFESKQDMDSALEQVNEVLANYSGIKVKCKY